MEQQKYWKGFEELNNTPEFSQHKHKEFREELPLVSEITQLATEQTASRRDFLKVLGFSVSAAAIAASCEIPVNKAVPYVFKPEEVNPGIANYYASTFLNGSDYASVLVKTREGRPIKIEGNDLSTITQGATSARAQASVVSLYDGARLKSPQKDGKNISWETADAEIAKALGQASGKVVILSGSIASPSTKKAIEDFSKKYSNTEHVVYEAVSNAGILLANEQSLGEKIVPSYDFSKAEIIVSFGADFLGTWISPLEFTKQYVANRKISPDNPKMSKHWQFESYMSLTGANADKRYSVKPSEEGLAVVALYNEIVGGGASVKLQSNELTKAIQKAAVDLKAHQGKSLVVAASNDPNVQILVNAINKKLGSYGSTIDQTKPYQLHQGNDKAMNQLVENMNGGKVGALIIYGANPVYSYCDTDKLVAGLKKVKLTVSFNERADETSEHITYLCPDNHYLESWNDVEPKKGFFSIGQPTISPLFDTRQAQESLLTWAGETKSYYDYMRENWEKDLFSKSKFSSFQAFWDAVLHDGVFELDTPDKTKGVFVAGMYKNPESGAKLTQTQVVAEEVQAQADSSIVTQAEKILSEEVAIAPVDTTATPEPQAAPVPTEQPTTVSSANPQTAIQKITEAASKASGVELVLFENMMMGDGRYANNPFLQETPEPISKVCWDNFLAISKKYAEEQGWSEYDVIEVKVGDQSVKLPLLYQPGQPYGSVSIALGYGRTKAGNKHCNVGENAFPFISFNGETFDYKVLSGVALKRVGTDYAVARTQTHHTIDDSRPIVLETTLEEYKKDKWAGNHYAKHLEENKDKHFFTLYGEDKAVGPHGDAFHQGHHWGMAVDLTTCIGCGACVTACNVENNVPIVGQNEVFRAHEMHWMRIDRYYSGEDVENPEVTFMPMMCQHCDNAPCENVCPVAATNHSSEGLNQMAYNRCIGTRYCANNCPFKVRRFNWFDYQGADSFYKNTVFDNDEYVMVNDLTRMVLNPDVTVRARGVMEKCSFCVQRLQVAKLEAKKEGRPLKDGEAKTACQTGCPTNAIVFGDMNDENSEVMKLKKQTRAYQLLEEIHVVSSISYLTKIRNREPLAGGHGHDKGHQHQHHDDHGHDKHGHG